MLQQGYQNDTSARSESLNVAESINSYLEAQKAEKSDLRNFTQFTNRLESESKHNESSRTKASSQFDASPKKELITTNECFEDISCQRMESEGLKISTKIPEKSGARSISHYYKSLFRRFRGFIKTHFETKYVKRSTSQHWDQETLFRQTRKYMQDKLGTPDCLLTHENVYKMICLT